MGELSNLLSRAERDKNRLPSLLQEFDPDNLPSPDAALVTSTENAINMVNQILGLDENEIAVNTTPPPSPSPPPSPPPSLLNLDGQNDFSNVNPVNTNVESFNIPPAPIRINLDDENSFSDLGLFIEDLESLNNPINTDFTLKYREHREERENSDSPVDTLSENVHLLIDEIEGFKNQVKRDGTFKFQLI
jgi:hypothetical protein